MCKAKDSSYYLPHLFWAKSDKIKVYTSYKALIGVELEGTLYISCYSYSRPTRRDKERLCRMYDKVSDVPPKYLIEMVKTETPPDMDYIAKLIARWKSYTGYLKKLKKRSDYKEYRQNRKKWEVIRGDKQLYSNGKDRYSYRGVIIRRWHNGDLYLCDQLMRLYSDKRNYSNLNQSSLFPNRVNDFNNRLYWLTTIGLTISMVKRFIDWAIDTGNKVSENTMKKTTDWQ